MHAVRVVVELRDGLAEYVAHVNNRSRHCLTGSVRAAWKRYPQAKAVTAEFVTHDKLPRSRDLAQVAVKLPAHTIAYMGRSKALADAVANQYRNAGAKCSTERVRVAGGKLSDPSPWHYTVIAVGLTQGTFDFINDHGF